MMASYQGYSFPPPESTSFPGTAFTNNQHHYSSANAESGAQMFPSRESVTHRSSASHVVPSYFSSGEVVLHGRQLQAVSPVSASANARNPQLASTTAPALVNSSSMAPLCNVPGSESIIRKQQREMELLVKELKDRDRELNDMVRMHQHHLGSWAEDKRKVVMLEQRCVELQELMSAKESGLLAVKASLSELRSKETTKSSELKALKRQHELQTARVQKLELQLGNAEAKLTRTQQQERSLRSLLEEKERELQALSRKMEEVQHLLDTKIHEIKSDEAVLREQVTSLAEQNGKYRKSAESLQDQLFDSQQRSEKLELDLARAKDEAGMLRKHLEVAYDSEKRKEQLLALQKSKLERYEVELTSTRKVCAQQQQEMTALNTSRRASQRKRLSSVNSGRSENHHRTDLEFLYNS